MAEINLKEYYPQLLYLDSFMAHRMSLYRVAELTAIKAYVEANYDRFYKKALISRELKKPFLQKLFELKGVV